MTCLTPSRLGATIWTLQPHCAPVTSPVAHMWASWIGELPRLHPGPVGLARTHRLTLGVHPGLPVERARAVHWLVSRVSWAKRVPPS